MSAPDVIEAMERFLARIEPFDPEPGGPVVSVEVRIGRARGEFALTDRAARALHEALSRYVDPEDNGPCDHCGSGRLDTNLHCRACGGVSGIFGATVAAHADDVRRRETPALDR